MPTFLGVLLFTIASTSQPIRSVDFRNFTYDFGDWRFSEAVRVVTGSTPESDLQDPADLRITDVSVDYADLTGDGTEEAIVVVDYNGGGNGRPTDVFVYTMSAPGPRLLHRFPDGDRANGGLFDVCELRGQLVLVREWSTGGAASPGGYETQIYRWTKRGFVLKSDKLVKFANPNEDQEVHTICGGKPFQF